MSINPPGEEIRQAIKWISAQRTDNARLDPLRLIESACLKFDLSPKDQEFLARFLKENKQG